MVMIGTSHESQWGATDPITPLWATRSNVASARLIGAEDIWLGDHVKSLFPSTAWSPKLSPMARFLPSLEPTSMRRSSLLDGRHDSESQSACR